MRDDKQMKKLLIGKINSSNTIGYWNIGENYTTDVISGDYAIVENKTDYDLIKIIGIVELREEYEKFLLQNKVSKKAIMYFARSRIKND